MTNDEFISLFGEDENDSLTAQTITLPAWRIAIVDDEKAIHDVTRLALKDVLVEGRPLEFISAFSATDGLKLLQDNPDVAVILLDVVMETDDAGLRLVEAIRGELSNSMIQIVLRTGQAGYAPEEEVISRYEINAYKTKSELTRGKLFTTIATAIRSYRHLCVIEESRQGLRAVINASAQMMSERSVSEFSAGVLRQIDALFGMTSQSFFCVSRRPSSGPFALKSGSDGYVVVAANDKFADWYGKDIQQLDQDSAYVRLVLDTLQLKEHQFIENLSCLYLNTPSGWEGVIVAEQSTHLRKADPELLQIFCMNVGLGLENAKYFNVLNQAAFKDELTGQLNRSGFLEETTKLSATCTAQLDLYVIDIDYFHHIVESLGYDIGNAILKKMAALLTEFFGDKARVARLHADVFAVAIADFRIAAKEVALRCAKPILIEGQSIRLGLTVGKSESINTGQLRDSSLPLRQAEIALKVAKEHKRGTGELFQQCFEQASRRNMTVLSDLRQALDKNELYLVLQPKVDIQNGNSIAGYEALLRWAHPQKGQITPGAFIPIVEKAGLNYDLDLYVAAQLCQIIKAGAPEHLRISFNISANSLNNDGFVDELISLFRTEQVSLDRVEIEVTENALIHSEQAIVALRRLYTEGFIICLDDFGAGYSSLSYLLRLPLHVIKIDRAFVADLTVSGDSQKILYGMLAIIQSVAKDVVIEGVETDHQLEMLKNLGVRFVQGYRFYYPMDVQAAFDLALVEQN